jgi:ATP-dependent RNA helicase SUPV3L1/SUV3
MSPPLPINPTASGRGVTAVLGPTNTGKTHLAIERMAAHSSGLIGLPLRLLAREVYSRLCAKVGVANVALITGEEKINPGTGRQQARYQVCTVEAMPTEANAAFVAIDEVQLAADLERGHIFTDRVMNLRGREETMLLGAATVEQSLRQLLPGLEVITRPRMSRLEYAGSKKITRMPPRSAIVAFSVNEVYAIAELIRRQRGGAAVVLGSLSPRTRNAQVALYQSGEVDFLVATDAIGMGLNLDLDHVAFAQDRKFDGFQHRRLTAAEMGQIAGRAGRHTRNGTFGVTGQVAPLDDELAMALETHEFAPTKVLTWRNRQLDFASVDALKFSLERPSANRLLMKALPASDVMALETLSRDQWISGACRDQQMVSLLWDVCCIPDYRKISPASHADLLARIFGQISQNGVIDETWLGGQVNMADDPTGGLDALSNRIAQIRTWTYLAHRADWLHDAPYWQERTREIEDRLSDALHEGLTKRFIDRRTSLLMRKLRENTHMEANIKPDGEIEVEGHLVGRLSGFRFTPETGGESPEAKAANAAAAKVLASEIERRATRLAASANTDFILSSDATLRWMGDPVAKLVAGESPLKPRMVLIADEQLTGPARDKVASRLERWVANHVSIVLKPLVEMGGDQTLEGMARGVAFRIIEACGNIDRREILEDVQSLSQDMRASLRRHGVRFGAYTIFVPALLKPAPAELLCLLWGLGSGKFDVPGLTEIPAILASGRTSTVYNPEYENEAYRLCGYRILGQKAVRIDILERLADLIRPALYWKAGGETPKPDGAIDGRSFYVTPAMMSILGATHEDMELILKGLGYRGEPKPQNEIVPQVTAEQAPATSGTGNAVTPETGSITEPAEKVELAQSENGIAPEAALQNSQAEPTQPTPNSPEPEKADGPTALDVETDGPKTIIVWRMGGAKNRGHAKKSKGGAGHHPARDKPEGKQSRGNGARTDNAKPADKKDNRRVRLERAPDPDSPFAKLAALKDSMKKQ